MSSISTTSHAAHERSRSWWTKAKPKLKRSRQIAAYGRRIRSCNSDEPFYCEPRHPSLELSKMVYSRLTAASCRRALCAATLVAISLLWIAPPAWSQPRTASLAVTVVDQTGAVIGGATVTITGTDDVTKTTGTAAVMTSNEGIANLPNLVPGRTLRRTMGTTSGRSTSGRWAGAPSRVRGSRSGGRTRTRAPRSSCPRSG
jgi:hypothetical protein